MDPLKHVLSNQNAIPWGIVLENWPKANTTTHFSLDTFYKYIKPAFPQAYIAYTSHPYSNRHQFRSNHIDVRLQYDSKCLW